MDWLIPDGPDRLAEHVRERADRDGPLLATGAPGPSEEVRRLPGAGDAVVLSTAELDGPPDLRPRDLTVSVSAGTRVADLQRTLAGEGLWLALGGPALGRSVGGAVAAASPGPWDRAYGDLRRQLLACRLVTWRGTRARWGRAVMKDVAGYGTVRAVAGSAGRLGVIHHAVFRVWPRPGDARSLLLAPDDGDDLGAAGRVATSDLDARARPDAVRWERSSDTGPEGRLEAWLAGTETSVAGRADRLADEAGGLGLEAAGERTGFDPLAPPASAGPARSPEVGVAVLRPGRGGFGEAARAALAALDDAAVRTVGYPLSGVLRVAWRREGPEDDGPLARLLEAAGETPVRLERGTAAEHAAADARRSGAAADLEGRAVEALEGRPRHWLSDHL